MLLLLLGPRHRACGYLEPRWASSRVPTTLMGTDVAKVWGLLPQERANVPARGRMCPTQFLFL